MQSGSDAGTTHGLCLCPKMFEVLIPTDFGQGGSWNRPVLGNYATGFCSPIGKAIPSYFSSMRVFTFLPKPKTPPHQLLQVAAFRHSCCRDDSTQEIPRFVLSCFLLGNVVARWGFAWSLLPISFWGLLCSSKPCVSFAWGSKLLALFILEGCWKWHRPLTLHHPGHVVAHLCALPCDQQLLKCCDSERPNPNPKLLSTRLPLAGSYVHRAVVTPCL